MTFQEIFSTVAMVLAGCGALLVGFKLLSDNMERLFGNALKKLFNKTSEKKLVGVGMGAVTTAVIQSSGVTTVMVVGFVNAGIMSLYQAASIIMGANIGTTITAQIAALGDLPVSEFFILMLGVGVFVDLFAKNDKLKSAGMAIAGLGMVFLGLEVMSSTMKVYADIEKYPQVAQFLSSLTNPFLLLLFGIVFTALMQSSSAVTSIIISMASAGLVIGQVDGQMTNAVLYVILGSNIGSCVTALISSIGTSVNARRASIMHLLFNVIGSLLFMVMLLVWQDFYATTFASWFSEESTQIAMFHTAFNVICTLLFMPFTKLLVKASTILVPDKKEEEEEGVFAYMDKRLLATPAVAIGQLTKEVFRMADMAMESLRTAFDGFISRDVSAIDKVAENNEKVAKLGTKISNYLVKVSAGSVSLSDEKLVTALHKNVGDIARVAELADNLCKYTKKAVKDNLIFSKGIDKKLEEMHGLLEKQYELVKKIVLEKQYGLLLDSDTLENEVDCMRRSLVEAHIERLAQGKCKPENNTIFINLVCNLERIGDHLSFVAHSVEVAESVYVPEYKNA